jgi:hypothetical protein
MLAGWAAEAEVDAEDAEDEFKKRLFVTPLTRGSRKTRREMVWPELQEL